MKKEKPKMAFVQKHPGFDVAPKGMIKLAGYLQDENQEAFNF